MRKHRSEIALLLALLAAASIPAAQSLAATGSTGGSYTDPYSGYAMYIDPVTGKLTYGNAGAAGTDPDTGAPILSGGVAYSDPNAALPYYAPGAGTTAYVDPATGQVVYPNPNLAIVTGGGAYSDPSAALPQYGAAEDAAPMAPAATPFPFWDVAQGEWYYNDVKWAVDNGMFEGVGAGVFSPLSGMSRAMFLTVLHRIAVRRMDVADGAYANGYLPYTDAAAGSWYAEALSWATATGVLPKPSDGRFRPDANITRQDMCVILNNYVAATGTILPPENNAPAFTDEGLIDKAAYWAVKAMQQGGVVTGRTGSVFDPLGTATRAEVAAILRRFTSKIA
jgi:hypothetical protein